MSAKPPTSYLGIGLYSVADVARILRVPASKIRRWAQGYTWGGGKSSAPLFRRDYPELAAEGTLTFLDLVELRMIAQYRAAGLSMQAIRAVADDLAQRLQTSHPLATQRLHTDGQRFYMEADVSGAVRSYYELPQFQMAMEFCEEFFVKLEYEGGMPMRFWPLGKNRPVVLDPARRFGKPIVYPESVPTYAIYGPFTAGESVESLAQWFQLPKDAVKAAIEYEMERAA